MPTPDQPFIRNRLLSGLTRADYELLPPDLEAVTLDKDVVLEDCHKPIGADEIHLLKAPEQHRNWLDAIRTGEPLSAPAEIGH